ncbi:hypothetical protein [Gillisia mitskevichiae]|nr:hypothetical protein [Gillisia mitskevichiae]
MIFFKKLRKKYSNKRWFGKYIFYALGELILIILGIMLALNFDNNNDRNQNEEQFIYTLSQLQNELKANIEMTRKGIRYYEDLDSKFSSVMSDTLKASDLRTWDGYYLTNFIFNSFTSEVTNNNYQKLNQYSVNIDEKYNPVIDKLDELYLIEEKRLITLDDRMKKLTELNEIRMENQEPWFYHYFWTDKISDEAADFFINDSIHKNRIAGYYKLSRGHLKAIKHYRVKAIECYSAINKLIDPQNKNELISLGYSVNKLVLNSYVGKYKYEKSDQAIISIKNDKLHVKIMQGGKTFNSQLYPLSINEFFIINESMIFKFQDFFKFNSDSLVWKMFGVDYKFIKSE